MFKIKFFLHFLNPTISLNYRDIKVFEIFIPIIVVTQTVLDQFSYFLLRFLKCDIGLK